MNFLRRKNGQALIEFALAFPIFILLIFGLIDLARYYFIEQSISYTLRAAGRYAVTGQLMTNTSYNAASSNSFPYQSRRASIIAAAQANNPAGTMLSGIQIVANPTNYATNDNFTIMSSTNFNGPWVTNSTSGVGGDYVRIQLTYDYYFVTPLLNQLCSAVNNGQPLRISGSLIMKDEAFQTNAYAPTNASGSSTNYWN